MAPVEALEPHVSSVWDGRPAHHPLRSLSPSVWPGLVRPRNIERRPMQGISGRIAHTDQTRQLYAWKESSTFCDQHRRRRHGIFRILHRERERAAPARILLRTNWPATLGVLSSVTETVWAYRFCLFSWCSLEPRPAFSQRSGTPGVALEPETRGGAPSTQQQINNASVNCFCSRSRCSSKW